MPAKVTSSGERLREGGRLTSAPCECTAVVAWSVGLPRRVPGAWPCAYSFPAQAIYARAACQESPNSLPVSLRGSKESCAPGLHPAPSSLGGRPCLAGPILVGGVRTKGPPQVHPVWAGPRAQAGASRTQA